jgi:hypothetical protein
LLQKKRGQDKIKNRFKEEKVPTATDLLSGSERRLCVFCNKPHESKDCFSAPKLTLEEKKKKLSEKKACYACLMPGHSAKMCRAKLQCPICQRKHVVTMCPDLINSKKQSTANKESKQKEADTKSQTSNSDSESAHEASLTNLDTGPVLLQTLIVKLHNEDKTVAVRAMIDTGSQRSYVTSKAAQALHLKKQGTVDLVHSLFGGSTTPRKHHSLYQVQVTDLNGNRRQTIEVLENDRISGSIVRGCTGKWIEELKRAGIVLSDIGKETPDIHLLLGADVAGKLFTGDIYRTKEGPIAMKTSLGWTVMGPTVKGRNFDTKADSSMLVQALHIKDDDIQSLWKLDVLGIEDPAETKSQEEVIKSAEDHFRKTVKQDESGRYEVSLPWLECHPTIASNKEPCRKRLEKAVRNLVIRLLREVSAGV